MNVLVVQFWPKYEVALEIAQQHLDAGDRVTFMGCDGEMTACWQNPRHTVSICAKCVGLRKQGLALLEPRVPFLSFLDLTEQDRQELNDLPTAFASLEELKQFQVDNFDVGMAVASGLMTNVRDADLDVHAHQTEILRLTASSVAVFRSLQNYLGNHQVDCVYVANGRGCEVRGAFRACQSRGVKCVITEGGRDKNHYELFDNELPHDLKFIEGRIVQAWRKAQNDPNRLKIAEQWYLDRARGVEREFVSFVKEQQHESLPSDFDPKRHNIAVFNSSEDEYACVSDTWKNPLYRDQEDGLRRICASATEWPAHIHLYLRIHPNLKRVQDVVQRLLALQGPRCTVIAPEDSVSTYALLRACNTVLTFGSTVGIEAVFFGKPSILAGQCYYRNLGGTYTPETHERLIELLTIPLEPKDREPALAYGYYWATLGRPFQYYVPWRFPTLFHFPDGTFKGGQIGVRRSTHYFWAAIHRLPWLNRLWNERHLARSQQALHGKNESADRKPTASVV